MSVQFGMTTKKPLSQKPLSARPLRGSGGMRLLVVGGGRVGLPTATAFAEMGHVVACCETNPAVLAKLQAGNPGFKEPRLREAMRRHIKTGALSFVGDLRQVGAPAPAAVFVAVPTNDGDNYRALFLCVEGVAAAMPRARVVIRSTIPPAAVDALAARHPALDFSVNPEFLRPGSAMQDFLRPDRVVVGASTAASFAVLKKVYRPLVIKGARYIAASPGVAALVKLSANFFLSLRVAAINEITAYCQTVEGGDMSALIEGLAADPRIGGQYLRPGVGFGGPCLPKDCKMLANASARARRPVTLATAAFAANEALAKNLARRIAPARGGGGKPTVAVWGGRFKPDGDGFADSRALAVIKLLARRANVRFWDPHLAEPADAEGRFCRKRLAAVFGGRKRAS